MEPEKTKARAFFVPDCGPDKWEEAYAVYAAFCPRAVPPMDKRIDSIKFTSRNEEWTATVGETLEGERYRTKRVRGKKVEKKENLRATTRVLAIFGGPFFMVVTDDKPFGKVGSEWNNPIMAGEPRSVVYFSAG